MVPLCQAVSMWNAGKAPRQANPTPSIAARRVLTMAIFWPTPPPALLRFAGSSTDGCLAFWIGTDKNTHLLSQRFNFCVVACRTFWAVNAFQPRCRNFVQIPKKFWEYPTAYGIVGHKRTRRTLSCNNWRLPYWMASKPCGAASWISRCLPSAPFATTARSGSSWQRYCWLSASSGDAAYLY